MLVAGRMRAQLGDQILDRAGNQRQPLVHWFTAQLQRVGQVGQVRVLAAKPC